MAKVLQNKNLATRFQILVEIAANQPNIQQKLIAEKIGITPQAISDYVAQLINDGLLTTDGRSRYQVTKESVDWVLGMAKELKEYSSFVEKAITNISICTAVAERNLSKGQEVGLKMRDGVLWASDVVDGEAQGIVVSDAIEGDDVGVSGVKGIVQLHIGHITIARVPSIGRGGSTRANLDELQKHTEQAEIVGAIGLEALSALRKIRVEPTYFYGVEAALVEAAYSGLSSFVVCVDDQMPGLVKRITGENLEYTIIDFCASM